MIAAARASCRRAPRARSPRPARRDWRVRVAVGVLTVVVPAGHRHDGHVSPRHVPAGVRVFAVPCVGSDTYLREQMRALVKDGAIAEVLMPPPPLRVQFAEPAHSVLGAWNEACAAGVLLDLVYGPIAWAAAKQLRLGDPIDRGGSGPHDSEVLLLNTGGQEGLHTQLARYRRERQLVSSRRRRCRRRSTRQGERSSLWFDDEPACTQFWLTRTRTHSRHQNISRRRRACADRARYRRLVMWVPASRRVQHAAPRRRRRLQSPPGRRRQPEADEDVVGDAALRQPRRRSRSSGGQRRRRSARSPVPPAARRRR